jgi:hypothetical protein
MNESIIKNIIGKKVRIPLKDSTTYDVVVKDIIVEPFGCVIISDKDSFYHVNNLNNIIVLK